MALNPNDFLLEFSGRSVVRGRAQKMLADARGSLGKTFKSGAVEKQILANIQARLTDPKKQRDPETGKAWPKLSKTTVGRRKSNIESGKVKLVDTGSMRRALVVRKKGLGKTTGTRTGFSQVGFRKGAVSRSSPGFLIEDIAANHQFGTVHPNGRILPARPFLGVSKKEGKEIEKLFELRLNAALIEFI